MLTLRLNRPTVIIFPTDPTQGELIHVAGRTQVALPFSQKPLLLWLRLFDDISITVSVGTYAKDLPEREPRENILCSKYKHHSPVGRISATDGPLVEIAALPALFLPQSQNLARVFSAISSPCPACISHSSHLCFLSSVPSCYHALAAS